MSDRTTVQGATFNIRGQLYRGHANATSCPVVQWSVHWAPSRTTRVLVLRRAGKKMRAPLLGLVKSIYYFFAKFEFTTCSPY